MNKFNTWAEETAVRLQESIPVKKKNFFSAFRASVWSKNKGVGRAGPFSGSATVWSRHVTSRHGHVLSIQFGNNQVVWSKANYYCS